MSRASSTVSSSGSKPSAALVQVAGAEPLVAGRRRDDVLTVEHPGRLLAQADAREERVGDVLPAAGRRRQREGDLGRLVVDEHVHRTPAVDAGDGDPVRERLEGVAAHRVADAEDGGDRRAGRPGQHRCLRRAGTWRCGFGWSCVRDACQPAAASARTAPPHVTRVEVLRFIGGSLGG